MKLTTVVMNSVNLSYFMYVQHSDNKAFEPRRPSCLLEKFMKHGKLKGSELFSYDSFDKCDVPETQISVLNRKIVFC